jgi:ATP-dependent Lhr-like helicase
LADGRIALRPSELAVPVLEQAVKKLKFAELLPPALANATLAARGADLRGAIAALNRPVVAVHA